MSNNSSNEIFRNFFSVLSGVITAFAVLISLVAFLLFSGIIEWGAETSASADTITPKLSLGISIIIAAIAGGYTTAKISINRKWIYIGLTGMIILLVSILTNEFDLGYTSYWKYIFLLLLFPSTFLGGYWGLRRDRIE